jgi:hypothetical protein
MIWFKWSTTATTGSLWGISIDVAGSGSRAAARIVGTSGLIQLLGRRLDADALTNVTSASSAASNGVWTHWAVIYDFNNRPCYLYKDGVLLETYANFFAVGSGNCSDTTNLNTSIAASPLGTTIFGNGDAEDFRIYNRALTANEIQTIANCYGHDGIVYGLQGRYLMNENSAGVAYAGTGTIRDVGPFSRYGTQNGSPTGVDGRLSFVRKRRRVLNK